ncbi:hypothetical protein F5Y06DRAFT_74305 [Hypoxylon sp. FL0890]|nr:hypothetical protein F5Y06DRAFT_74305 [Hypoxylon sp. FL0890]
MAGSAVSPCFRIHGLCISCLCASNLFSSNNQSFTQVYAVCRIFHCLGNVQLANATITQSSYNFQESRPVGLSLRSSDRENQKGFINSGSRLFQHLSP